MKSFQAIVASSLVAGLVAGQSAVAGPVSEIMAILPTSAIAANPGFMTENSPALATLEAKVHSIVAANQGFFDTFSGAIPGFGGMSALVETAYDTALLTGGSGPTSTGSSSAVTTTTSSTPSSVPVVTGPTPTSFPTITVTTTTSSGMTSVPPPTSVPTPSSTLTTTTYSSNSTWTTSTAQPYTGAAAPTAAFGVYGAAVAGVAGLAAALL